MRLNLTEVRQAVSARPLPEGRGDIRVTGVSTDSRTVAPGHLFVCIPGERVDGHDFAARAMDSGAVAVLTQRDVPGLEGAPVLRVEHTVTALGALGAYWRARTAAKVVGVTGTAGKTTVKDVLSQVLSVHGVTARTAGNHNNQIGLPLSLCNAPEDAAFWVMEAGISHDGDMDMLASLLRPDVALVLNVGSGHTEGLGRRGVAWHKAQLLAHLAPGGMGLVSGDYPDLVREARAVCPQVRFFSAAGRPMPFRGAYAGISEAGRGRYRLWLDGLAVDVETPFRGSCWTENAVAVAAVARVLGLSAEEIIRGFADAVLPEQRFQMCRVGGWRAIDDTYNANPLSMARMLDTAGELAAGAPLICVLGEMRELGDVAAAEHERLGRHLARLRPAAVFWRGGHLADLRSGLEAEGYDGPLVPADDAARFMEDLETCLPSGGEGVVLFKGSRSNHLEKLFNAFARRGEGN